LSRDHCEKRMGEKVRRLIDMNQLCLKHYFHP